MKIFWVCCSLLAVLAILFVALFKTPFNDWRQSGELWEYPYWVALKNADKKRFEVMGNSPFGVVIMHKRDSFLGIMRRNSESWVFFGQLESDERKYGYVILDVTRNNAGDVFTLPPDPVFLANCAEIEVFVDSNLTVVEAKQFVMQRCQK